MALDSSEHPNKPIKKFESMLKTDDVYFFDAEDFEDIIHYYLNMGKIALGKKAIQFGLQQHPHSIDIKLLRVEVLVFEDNFNEASKILDELQNIDSSNEEIYIQRANIESKQDNHRGAVDLLLEALSISENSFDLHSLLGMEYLFMDNYEKAKLSFMKCIEFDDSDYSSLYNVVYCFEFLEDFDGAIHYLNEYLNRNPYCQVAWHQLGKMYLSIEMCKEALTAFDFAIISDDTFIGAYFEKGKVLEKMGRYAEAIESYETTIKIDDPTSHAYLRIGKCYEKLKNYDQAQHYFYNTVHEDPLLDKGWLAITNFYHKKGSYKKALKYINKAINIDGENPLYWVLCANIYMDLENYDEADFAFKQAVDLGNYELETWFAWAQALRKLSDFKSAKQVLLQGLEFYPESAKLNYFYAGVALKDGDLKTAKKTLEYAIELDVKLKPEFEKEFPEFNKASFAIPTISQNKKASTK